MIEHWTEPEIETFGSFPSQLLLSGTSGLLFPLWQIHELQSIQSFLGYRHVPYLCWHLSLSREAQATVHLLRVLKLKIIIVMWFLDYFAVMILMAVLFSNLVVKVYYLLNWNMLYFFMLMSRVNVHDDWCILRAGLWSRPFYHRAIVKFDLYYCFSSCYIIKLIWPAGLQVLNMSCYQEQIAYSR